MSIMQVIIKSQRGFTLLEMAIALTIISIILFGSTVIINKTDAVGDYQENQKYLEETQQALMTFVQVNGYLPCPDTDQDGRENRELTNECSDKNGAIPYLDLGISSADRWNNPLYYAINNRADGSGTIEINDQSQSASYFNNQDTPQPFFNYQTAPFGSNRGTGNYTVCRETAADCDSSTASADTIEFAAIAVVISFGKNGSQTWSLRASGNESQLNSAEEENADDDNYFWQAQYSDKAAVNANFFDDQLFWITAYDVKSAVIKSPTGVLEDTP